VAGLTKTTALRARPTVIGMAMAQQARVLLAVVAPPMVAGALFAEWAFALSLLPQTLLLVTIALL